MSAAKPARAALKVNRAQKSKLAIISLLSLFLLPLLGGCKNTSSLDATQPDSTLTIVTRRSPTTYFEDQRGPNGFEYLLAQSLANQLGKQLKILTVDSLDDVFAAIHTGQADIAAAGLTITEQRRQHLRFTQAYLDVTQLVLYRAGRSAPQDSDDLSHRQIAVQANSSHAERLEALKQQNKDLTWQELDNITTEELLSRLHHNEIDIVIADSNEYLILQNRYPTVKVAFELSPPEYIGWAMAKDRNEVLFKQTQSFLNSAKKDGTLDHLSELFYSHYEESFETGLDTRTFSNNITKRLPKYQQTMQDVALKNGLDWRLIAAISYQESHWRPRAKSPTGVRGMMMLTQPTAKEVGVTNRLDAQQSLEGGAHYFLKLHQRLPEEIQEPDRTWFTLAAYNVGWGHLEDAREITHFQGGDANRWVDVKERLPLLERKEWYKYTKHGYARGNEPVTYVQRIRHYYEVLAWRFPNTEAAPFLLAGLQ